MGRDGLCGSHRISSRRMSRRLWIPVAVIGQLLLYTSRTFAQSSYPNLPGDYDTSPPSPPPPIFPPPPPISPPPPSVSCKYGSCVSPPVSPPSSPPPPPPSPPPPPTIVVEPWIPNKYPASDFRASSVPPRFKLWPENLTYIKLEYYCEDAYSKRSLSNFTYTASETGLLVSRPYFDVGIVDEDYTPYFKKWRFWQTDTRRLTCNVRCEYSDLQRLYEYRLYHKVIGMGFGYGLAALAILQLSVMAFIVLLSIPQQYRRGQYLQCRAPLTNFVSSWYRSLKWSDCFPAWIHLVLLVIVGLSMMEAVGHSNFFGWRSMLLYNTGVVYTYLTISVMVSSFLHQIAHFLSDRKFLSDHPKLERSLGQRILQKSVVPETELTTSSLVVQIREPTTSPKPTSAKRKMMKELSEDWKYQRMFGQFGVLVLMGAYLLTVDDDAGTGMDSLAGIVVAAIVVACIWSGGVAAVVAFRALQFILCINSARTDD